MDAEPAEAPHRFAPSSELSDYPPILEAVMPAVILVTSVVYAFSLRGISLPEMNLLLLRPLFAILWILLAVVVIRELVPALRRQRSWSAARQPRGLRHHFAPGTQAGAGLVVLATFVFSWFGPGDGPLVYVVSLFVYALAVGLLMGERRIARLILRAVAITGLLYLIMGVLLGVRL